jgi:hypothetical protein
MTYILIHTIHIFSVIIYAGFLFVDIFFLSKMPLKLNEEEHKKARKSIMIHVKKVVPWALMVAVVTGLYMISQIFGTIGQDGMNWFQTLLSIKAFLGILLGIRGFSQKVLNINPPIFRGHTLAFTFVILIIFLSQFMYL